MVKFYIERKKANVNASAIEGYLAAFGKDRMDKKKSAVYLHAFRLLLALFWYQFWPWSCLFQTLIIF